MSDSKNSKDRFQQIGEEFKELKEVWIKETAHISSPIESATHPAYQDIIGLGLPVIPFMIKDMEKNNTHWFWALRAITGANPIKESHEGNIEAMVEDWKKWWDNRLDEVTVDFLSKL